MAKKKVNVELNMTAFIGLFALLVVMLLLTAVWNRLSVLSTNTDQTTSSDQAPPPDLNKKLITLNVTILPDKVEMAENDQGINVPHINDQIDTMRIVQILEFWRQKHPDKTDIVLNTENSIEYNKLIKVFDTLVGNGWPDVGINTQ